jgi:glutathionyl-hydroquinone reductase
MNFLGRINEDVNTYTTLGSRGQVFLTIADAMINQLETQTNSGGMTDVYLAFGTYLKSFYSVMHMPNAVKLKMMGDKYYRIHHEVNWEVCVPKIVSGVYKKV